MMTEDPGCLNSPQYNLIRSARNAHQISCQMFSLSLGQIGYACDKGYNTQLLLCICSPMQLYQIIC
ncbi:hypothetical protein SBV1_3160006 [Verrucomicrobia bacterium]|nr:hypothetical protein SBV1_3160006 [Verrucomicrobiota bacterium]